MVLISNYCVNVKIKPSTVGLLGYTFEIFITSRYLGMNNFLLLLEYSLLSTTKWQMSIPVRVAPATMFYDVIELVSITIL